MNKYLLTLVLVLPLPAFALQFKPALDNDTLTAQISNKELNRISVAGDRIQHMRGASGAYIYKNDNQQGEVYIQPTDFYLHKSFSVFITTEQGKNYTLRLIPKNMAADTILIEPRDANRRAADQWERGAPYTEALTRLIAAMVNHIAPDGYAVNAIDKPIAQHLGDIATYHLNTIYQGVHLSGRIYELHNRLSTSITLSEREFWHPGVRAVTLQDETVAPHDSTLVYIVENA